VAIEEERADERRGFFGMRRTASRRKTRGVAPDPSEGGTAANRVGRRSDSARALSGAVHREVRSKVNLPVSAAVARALFRK
jgi:hypothetical protein